MKIKLILDGVRIEYSKIKSPTELEKNNMSMIEQLAIRAESLTDEKMSLLKEIIQKEKQLSGLS